jgi:tetratricopeptide (TPR) repeat protein
MATPDLDKLWDYSDAAASEKRFRELPVTPEILTQIARAQGLQGKFAEAHQTLDSVATNTPTVEVRYLLERGRVFNSSGKPNEARPLFLAAWNKAQAAKLDDYAVDAAHMLGILDGNEWNLKALVLAEKSPDPKAQAWVGSLLNNIGWAHYDKGEYREALAAFERDVKWFDERKKTEPARIARYSAGKTVRALGRYEEALQLQKSLKPDGYVHEEIAECLLALGRDARAEFALAYAELNRDEWFRQNEPKRLERLRQQSQ